MAPNPSFVPAPEQSALRAARGVPRPGGSSSGSAAAAGAVGGKIKFQKMTGQKDSAGGGGGASEEEEDDGGEEDEGDGEGEAAGTAKGKGKKKAKHPNKRNTTSTGRKKISISYIEDKARRSVTFTKRKSGLMKKAYEISTLTGIDCCVVLVSESGMLYTFSTPGLSGVTDHPRGQAVITASLKGEIRGDGKGGEEEPSESGRASRRGSATPGLAGDGGEHFAMGPALGGLRLPEMVPPSLAAGQTGSFPSFDHYPVASSSSAPPLSHAAPAGAEELPVPPLHFGNPQPQPQPSSSSFDFSAPPPAPPTSAPLPQPAFSSSSNSLYPYPFSAPLPSASTSTAPAPSPPLSLQPSHLHAHLPLSAPPPSSTASEALTPYALARLNHAQAFASYQAAAPFERVGRVGSAVGVGAGAGVRSAAASVAMSARSVSGGGGGGGGGAEESGNGRKRRAETAETEEGARRVRERTERSLSLEDGGGGRKQAGEAGGEKEKGKEVAQGAEGIEERRVRWKRKAVDALAEAKQHRTLPLSLRAHAYSLISALPLPPLVPPYASEPERAYAINLDLEGDGEGDDPFLLYASLERMCAKAGLEGTVEEELERAVGEFEGRWLPHELSSLPPAFQKTALAHARPLLIALFDFLEAHGLVSEALHMRLASFRIDERAKEKGVGEEGRGRLYGPAGARAEDA
ncbi:hypothetical protein JCM10213_006441 [Rhodosporidiobolus nylandii]